MTTKWFRPLRFDFGVNAGLRRAKYLQTMIGTVADGGIGPNTLAKLKEYVEEHGLAKAIDKDYQEARQKYYEKLSTFGTFGRGWTRRVDETTQLARL